MSVLTRNWAKAGKKRGTEPRGQIDTSVKDCHKATPKTGIFLGCQWDVMHRYFPDNFANMVFGLYL